MADIVHFKSKPRLGERYIEQLRKEQECRAYWTKVIRDTICAAEMELGTTTVQFVLHEMRQEFGGPPGRKPPTRS
jgi:hypothetical protein